MNTRGKLRVLLGLLLGIGVICGYSRAADPAAPSEADRRAEALVQSALQAELRGDESGRARYLREAMVQSSSYAPAQWHLGRVDTGQGFEPVTDSIEASRDNEDLLLYRRLRDEALGDPAAEERLARHCARLGLAEQSKLFYYRVAINPQADRKSRLSALRKLGLKPAYGTYLTRQQVRDRELAEREQKATFNKWLPKLAKWQKTVVSGRRAPIDFAVREIHKIDDKQFIPVADAVAIHVRAPLAAAVVEVLRKHPEFEATQALARYAVVSPSKTARTLAIEELQRRPLHDFVPLLLTALVAPLESRWKVETDDDGNVYYRHQLYQDNQQAKVLADLTHVDVRVRGRNERFEGPNDERLGTTRTVEEENSPRDREAQLARLARDREKQIDRFNEQAAARNARAAAALEATTNQNDLEVGEWQDWWQKYNQSYVPRPTQYVYRRSEDSYLNLVTDVYTRHSCFVAGTPVWTDQGLRPIESIRVGDHVLSQDVNSGELLWKLVIRTTSGESASTHVGHLSLSGTSLFPTLGHVLWVSGKGWRTAERVESGDLVHTLGGSVRVTRHANQPLPETVYNLVVPGTHTYFVGEHGVLVHDITTRQPTRSILPGLVPTE